MTERECSLCYRKMPMTNEKLREWYCKILKVDAICDDCLENIEKSRKEYFARKNINQGVMMNAGKGKEKESVLC